MAPDVKSLSWQRNDNARNTSLNGSTRRRLSDMFDKEQKPKDSIKSSPSGPLREMRQFSLTKLRLPRASPTRRAFRNGADRISKTFQQLRISVDAFSQRLRRPTRRRCRLENVDTPAATPQTRSRRMLGRTPTKMYSPFGIETPNPFNHGTPRRSRGRQVHLNHGGEGEEENERPMTRGLVQTQAMLAQPSPACKTLL